MQHRQSDNPHLIKIAAEHYPWMNEPRRVLRERLLHHWDTAGAA